MDRQKTTGAMGLLDGILKQIRAKDIHVLILFTLLSLYRTLGHVHWRVVTGLGLPLSPDGQWYIDYAQALLKNFSIHLNIDEVLYAGFNVLLAFLLYLFKDPVTVVYVQAITASLAIVLVYKIAFLLFNRRTAIFAACGYLYLWDVTLWSLYVLSDSFFVSLQLLCVYLLLRAMEPGNNLYRTFFAISFLYLCFFRPAGIVVGAVILLYALSRLERQKSIAFLKKHRWTLISFLLVGVSSLGILYSRHIFDILIYSLQYNAKLVLYNVYAYGWIYDISTPFDYFYQPDYTIDVFDSLILSFIINNWESVSILYLRRAMAFLGTWVWEIQVKTWGDAFFFAIQLSPFLLFIVGTYAALRNGTFARASILWLVSGSIFAFCVLLFIDAMYRYRFPAMPFIAIIIAYGLDRTIYGGVGLVNKYRTATK